MAEHASDLNYYKSILGTHSKAAAISRVAIVVVVIVVIVIAGVAGYVLTRPSSSVKVPAYINIGSVLSLTGPSSTGQSDMQWALNYWVNQTNSQGGIFMSAYNKKIPVKLTILDDASDNGADPQLYNELVNTYNVSAIVQGSNDGSLFVELPVVERLGVPFVTAFSFYNSTWSLYQGVDPTPKWAYFVWYNTYYDSTIWFNWMNSLNSSTKPTSVAAVAASITGFGLTAGLFLSTAAQNGYKVALPLQTYDVASTDLSSLVLKLKAANPDVVFAMSFDPDGILLIKQANQLGFHPKLWIMPITGGDPGLYATLGSEANGVMTDGEWQWTSSTPGTAQIVAAYKSQVASATNPCCDTALGYASGPMQALLNAIGRAGTTNRTAIASALQTTDMTGMVGHVQFNSGHDSYTVIPAIYQWQNGDITTVYPPANATASVIYPIPGSG